MYCLECNPTSIILFNDIEMAWAEDPLTGIWEAKWLTFSKISNMFDILLTFVNLPDFASWHT